METSDKSEQSIIDRLYAFIDNPKSTIRMDIADGNIIMQVSEVKRHHILTRLHENFQKGSDEYKEFGAFWLGMMSFRPAYETLLQHLHNQADNVVIAVINGLGLFSDVSAIPHLISFIYHPNNLIQKKSIEAIGNLGENSEGLQYLIHQLYVDPVHLHPSFLETYILSFGGRVLNLLSYEIDFESNPTRKTALLRFFEKVTEHHKIPTKDNYEILL